MRYLTPIPKQFVDQSGVPYSDGTVSVYLSGDTEFANIYEAAEGDALCPNPCVLDSNGAWQCFVAAGIPLDYIVKDKNGNVVFEFYDIVPGGGDSSICNIIGVEGETKVTERVNAEGSVTATVGLDPEFKQRVTDAENDIEDLSERVDGVEGSINEINNEVDELDGKVDEAVEKAEAVEQSLANKKDRQEPYSVTGIPANRTISGFSQDADGRMNIQTQEINYPDSQINISSPEDTLDITKYTPSPNTQDFHADVKDYSLTARKLKVSEFKYLDVDGDTIEKDVDGNCITLKVTNPLPVPEPGDEGKVLQVTDNSGSYSWVSKTGGAKHSHTAELYLYEYDEDTHTYTWHVRNVKNYCINHVAVTNHNGDICSVLIEAPTLAAGEEYDYVVVFDCNNSTGSCNVSVENCDCEITRSYRLDRDSTWLIINGADNASDAIVKEILIKDYSDAPKYLEIGAATYYNPAPSNPAGPHVLTESTTLGFDMIADREINFTGSPQCQVEVLGGRFTVHRF